MLKAFCLCGWAWILIPAFVQGQNTSAARLKRQFVAAIERAEEGVIGAKDDAKHAIWTAQNGQDAYFRQDTIVFYNFYNSPAEKASCRRVSWNFQHAKALRLEVREACQEPPLGQPLAHYTITIHTRSGQAILELTTNGNTEMYKIVSLEDLRQGHKRFFRSRITLVRLRSTNSG